MIRTKTSVRDSDTTVPLRRAFLLIGLALTWFALPVEVRAVIPAPDGGYPNGNTAEGDDALFSLTSGVENTAIGFQSLMSNTTGFENTALGHQALADNSTGFSNTALGASALFNNTIGGGNTATGVQSLFSNTTGRINTATGYKALYSNTDGSYNTATGVDALSGNTTGANNTANGDGALQSNTVGGDNTASGYSALLFNTTGGANTANGVMALFTNSTGRKNTASGVQALANNGTGSFNVANGNQALYSNSSGSNNIALGDSAGYNVSTGSNNIHIGALGATSDANTIRLGRAGLQTSAFITGIRGATVAGGVAVMVAPNGQLGTLPSSGRYKQAIQPMNKVSEAVLALRPVTFCYNKELDPEAIPQFGLVAEQVEKVNPDLVARDEEGRPYSVRYEAVNVMLLNEFLKEHRKVEEQGDKMSELETTIAQQQKEFRATVGQQQNEIASLSAALKAQAVQIQNVSTQLRAAKSATRLASDRE